jgi:hypothetical protein
LPWEYSDNKNSQKKISQKGEKEAILCYYTKVGVFLPLFLTMGSGRNVYLEPGHGEKGEESEGNQVEECRLRCFEHLSFKSFKITFYNHNAMKQKMKTTNWKSGDETLL